VRNFLLAADTPAYFAEASAMTEKKFCNIDAWNRNKAAPIKLFIPIPEIVFTIEF
jgi:hypothetical protein